MNLLLDTHALLWFISDDDKLSESLKATIEDENNQAFISIASLWEIAVKHSINKLVLKKGLTELFHEIESAAFKILPISTKYVLQVSSLQFHHRDPFDRLLIAQALVENLTIITKDHVFSAYDVNIKWN